VWYEEVRFEQRKEILLYTLRTSPSEDEMGTEEQRGAMKTAEHDSVAHMYRRRESSERERS
jgi:hypothetical protein